MGVATALGIGSLAVGAAGLIANQVNQGNSSGQAQNAAQQQAAQAAASAAAAKSGAASLSPEVEAQNSLAQQTAASNGLANQSSVFNQLQGVANGTGPNPAQAALAQNTGANVASQAALQAGQRGAGSNVGLMARQIGQQGAATQQNAVGQGATLQAQQSLGALNQLGGIAGQQVGQQLTAQQQATQAAMNQQQLAQGLALGQQGGSNQAQGQQLGAQQAQNTALSQGIGGLASGLSTAAQSPPFAAKAATPTQSQFTPAAGAGTMPTSDDWATAMGAPVNKADGGLIGPKSYVTSHLYGAASELKMAMGGKVPAMVSPGEKYLSPSEAAKVAKGTKEALAAGMKIKGKAKVPGDSLKNDIVPKTLQEGGVVIPRTVVNQNSEEAAKKFVQAAKSKGGKK